MQMKHLNTSAKLSIVGSSRLNINIIKSCKNCWKITLIIFYAIAVFIAIVYNSTSKQYRQNINLN